MIRVLVAEDSPTVRALLVAILSSDQDLQVVGEAKDGEEAVKLALELRPDLITMDVEMPRLDGLEATKEIMIHAPTPILIVSSHASQGNVALSLDAVAAGALMVVATPANPLAREFGEQRDQFVAMAKAMARVKVVRRHLTRSARPPVPRKRDHRSAVRLVTIASSTGGPAALQRILSDLPGDFPVPILVVQHIAAGFVAGLAHWLSGSCRIRVKVATEGEPLMPGTVYIAPDRRHLAATAAGRIALSSAGPIEGFQPSATYLFDCAARVYGASLVAIILTGMGRDGVDGLRAVHAAGGLVLAQDEATSVVYGMPREALVAGVVDAVLPLVDIAPRLVAELASGDVNEG